MIHVTVRNGLTLAYVLALTNSALSLVTSFGVHLDDGQQAGIVAFVNAAVMLAARVLHLPEKTADGGTVAIRHVPVLEASPPPPAPAAPAIVVAAPPVERIPSEA
jgi:hypothetical protein